MPPKSDDTDTFFRFVWLLKMLNGKQFSSLNHLRCLLNSYLNSIQAFYVRYKFVSVTTYLSIRKTCKPSTTLHLSKITSLRLSRRVRLVPCWWASWRLCSPIVDHCRGLPKKNVEQMFLFEVAHNAHWRAHWTKSSQEACVWLHVYTV